MKKQYLAVAFLAVALGITACSSKKADTESTTAQEVESTEATSDEEVEEDYYYGFVSLVEDNVITVSEDGGNTAKFDISDAEITGADEIGEGDEVNVGFAGELSSDVTKATSVEIMTSAAEVAREEEADQEDLVVEGTIESADDSTITLKTEEGTYTLGAVATEQITSDDSSDSSSSKDSSSDATKTSRLTVISSESMIDSQITDTYTTLENLDLFMNAVTANFDKTKNVAIKAKSLEVSNNTMQHAGIISILTIFGIPLVILIYGFMRWWKRRKA